MKLETRSVPKDFTQEVFALLTQIATMHKAGFSR